VALVELFSQDLRLDPRLNLLNGFLQALVVEGQILFNLDVVLPAFLNQLLQFLFPLPCLLFRLQLLQLAKLIFSVCLNVQNTAEL